MYISQMPNTPPSFGASFHNAFATIYNGIIYLIQQLWEGINHCIASTLNHVFSYEARFCSMFQTIPKKVRELVELPSKEWSEVIANPPPPFISTGLRNRGSDCFMNALLQVIMPDPFYIKALCLHFNQHLLIKEVTHRFLVASCSGEHCEPLDLAHMIRNLSSGKDRNALLFPQIAGNDQEDPAEAYSLLFTAMNKYVLQEEYANGSPIVCKVLSTVTLDMENIGLDGDQAAYTDEECNPSQQIEGGQLVRESFEPYLLLRMHGFKIAALESLIETSLLECFSGSTRDVYCRVGEDVVTHSVGVVRKKVKFATAPGALVLAIPRICYGERRQQDALANMYYVLSTLAIDVYKPYIYLDSDLVESGECAVFEIRAVICHKGIVTKKGDSGGHYFTYRYISGKWHIYNDSTHHKVTEQQCERDIQNSSTFIYAVRINSDMSTEELQEKVRENMRKTECLQQIMNIEEEQGEEDSVGEENVSADDTGEANVLADDTEKAHVLEDGTGEANVSGDDSAIDVNGSADSTGEADSSADSAGKANDSEDGADA